MRRMPRPWLRRRAQTTSWPPFAPPCRMWACAPGPERISPVAGFEIAALERPIDPSPRAALTEDMAQTIAHFCQLEAWLTRRSFLTTGRRYPCNA
jgi:hypothetical protein